jgi:hypothetical protein
MAKLIFNIDQGEMECREASNIEFTVPDDMNIFEFKTMCIRLASAMGYGQGSINRAFSDISNDRLYNSKIDSDIREVINGLLGNATGSLSII